MSLFGSEPCLFNQREVIAEHTALGDFEGRPGIAGLAHVNRIDMSTPQRLAETDTEMLRGMSLKAYFSYIVRTVKGSGSGNAIRET